MSVGKFIFVCKTDINKLTSYIQQISLKIKTNAMKEKDLLRFIQLFLSKEKIGYNKEGIQYLFQLIPDRSITSMFDILQECFYKKHYISAENLAKVAVNPIKVEPELVPASRVLEPLERCNICK